MSNNPTSKFWLNQFFLSERNMMTIIILNAIVITLMYFPYYKDSWELKFLDQLFIIVFIVEACIKLSVLKPSGYFSNSWNRFDFFIVVVSLPSLLVDFIDIPDTSLFLILRLFRLLRLIRFINFVPHLGKIIAGLVRAIRSAVFVLMALMFIDFLLAIFTCHFYSHLAPEYFEDPLISAYSIFQMFTVEGWNEIPTTIASRLDNPFAIWMTRFYFVLVVLFGGIFGMSLANAVFVDEMTMDNTDVIEEKIDGLERQLSELRRLLEQNNGNIPGVK